MRMGLFTAASQDEDRARRMTFRARVGALLRRSAEGDDKKFEVSRSRPLLDSSELRVLRMLLMPVVFQC